MMVVLISYHQFELKNFLNGLNIFQAAFQGNILQYNSVRFMIQFS